MPAIAAALGVRATAVGFMVSGTTRVYFAGDTDIFPEMEGLGESLDLALLPIWGWGPSLGPGHLDPGRAAEAARLLAPRTVIPIHWGTMRRSRTACGVRRPSCIRRRRSSPPSW